MAETQLLAAEQLMQLLDVAVDQAKEAVLITSAQLDPPGPEILFVNPALCAMTGYSREEILHKTPRMLQGPKSDRAMLQISCATRSAEESRSPARPSTIARTAPNTTSNGISRRFAPAAARLLISYRSRGT